MRPVAVKLYIVFASISRYREPTSVRKHKCDPIQIPQYAMLSPGVLPTTAHHNARMAAPTSRLRTPVLLQTVFIKTRVQMMNERSKNSRLTTTNVGDRPSLSERNSAIWRSDASTRAMLFNTMAHSPISSKFQGIISRDPLGERRPANVGEARDGPGDDANGCVPELCNSINSMRSERAASCV
jgi:hypothetical protein